MPRWLTFRIRSLMLLLVILAVCIGAQFTYERWCVYSRLADGWQAFQIHNAARLVEAEKDLDEWQPLDPPKKDSGHHGHWISKEELAIQFAELDRLYNATLKSEVAEYHALDRLSSAMAVKYRTAASRPWQLVTRDPELPPHLLVEVLMRSDLGYRSRNRTAFPAWSKHGQKFWNGETSRGFRLER